MRHDPGLASSPPVRYILEVQRSGYSPLHSSSAVDGQPPREAAAYDGTSAQEDLLWAYGCSRGARSSSPSSARPARTSSRAPPFSRSSSPRRTSAGRSSPNARTTPSTLATTALKEADQLQRDTPR